MATRTWVLKWTIKGLCRRQNACRMGDKPFKPPESFIQASQARLARIKQLQEERAAAGGEPSSPPQVKSFLSAQIAAQGKPPLGTAPIMQRKPSFPSRADAGHHGRFRGDDTLSLASTSPSGSISIISPSPKPRFMSKTAIEVEKLRLQREERRLKIQEDKERKESMNEQELEIFQYRQAIDKFRVQYAKKRAAHKIKLNSKSSKPFKPAKIKVCVRKRPLNDKGACINLESSVFNFDIITTSTDNHPHAHIYLHEPKTKLDMSKEINTHRFTFDHVFDENATNEQVFKVAALPLIDIFLKGGKVTLFAYGQTGSGKTYTIFGQNGTPGIFESSCRHLFGPGFPEDKILDISFFEIYSGRVYDLFSDRAKVSLLEDARGRCQVVGQKEISVTSFDHLLSLVKLGTEVRTTGSTEANSQSSRSHAILQMCLKNTDGTTFGKFFMVDLAGSERGADTGNIDRQARLEGSEINKSLLALKECIRALHVRKTKGIQMHIPFRASKLTQVLRDSFVGKKSHTVMIAMISPGSSSVEHSLNTLRYADRVKEFRPESSPARPPSLNVSPDILPSEDEDLLSPTELRVSDPQFDDIPDEEHHEEETDDDDDHDDEDDLEFSGLDKSHDLDQIFGDEHDLVDEEEQIIK